MLKHWDERRDIVVVGTGAETIAYAADHWIQTARKAIHRTGKFAVALSGGSTPKAIYELLAQRKAEVVWEKVHLFWSDERAVPPDHPDSNYHMAMQAGFAHLPIPPSQIFRMKAESHLEENALDYERTLQKILGPALFDLVMLGIGEDGHTASLFPGTKALAIKDRLVAANHIPQKNTWRMTLTYPCINQSQQSVIYALGDSKQDIVPQILQARSPLPASQIGIKVHKALWILDASASQKLGSL